MPVFGSVKGSVVDGRIWTPLEGVEPQALEQIKNVASLPWAFHHVAVMPDCHYGKGSTVGSVVALKGAVSPAMVGVDLSCGMAAVRTNLMSSDLPDSLKDMRHQIERDIPVGFNGHKTESHLHMSEIAEDVKKLFSSFNTLVGPVSGLLNNSALQCGTLGGGNHFISVNLDTQDRVWLMLHSGSRGIGNKLATFHINRAKALIHNADLPDKDLGVFLSGTREMEEYRRDLYWAQDYAYMNRKVMMVLFQNAIKRFVPKVEFEAPIQCHHNYVSEESHFGEDLFVTRKGAISAKLGELGIIPGSMGKKSYVVSGLGNADSFNSASHGAGRRMSRNQARKQFTTADLVAQTLGVECRKDEGVVDEIPQSYKDIDVVMKNQEDLVSVVAELHEVLCVKG